MDENKNDFLLKKIESVALEYDLTIVNDYSGRGMYGAKCVGVICYSVQVYNIIAEIGLCGAKTDNMGRSYIVYYPYIQREDD